MGKQLNGKVMNNIFYWYNGNGPFSLPLVFIRKIMSIYLTRCVCNTHLAYAHYGFAYLTQTLSIYK